MRATNYIGARLYNNEARLYNYIDVRAQNYIDVRANILTCAPIYIYIYMRAYKSAPRHALVRDYRYNYI